MRTSRRFWKPTRYKRWTTEPGDPGEEAAEPHALDVRDGRGRPIVARLPLSRYRNGGASAPSQAGADGLGHVAPLLHRDRRHAGQGIGEPSRSRTRTMSPSAKTSGWPGSVRSASTVTRPARSTSAPGALGERRGEPGGGHAGGPDDGPRGDARRRAVRVLDRRRRRVDVDHGAARAAASRPAAAASARPSPTARAESRSGRGRRSRRAARGRCGVDRAEVAPQGVAGELGDLAGHLDPGGPAPTTTNVSHAARRSGSRSSSAASNAPRMPRADGQRALERLDLRRRAPPLVVAEVRVARAAGDDRACRREPVPAPALRRRPERPPRAARGRSASTSASSTRTLRSRRKIARSGYATSPGDSAPVATW